MPNKRPGKNMNVIDLKARGKWLSLSAEIERTERRLLQLKSERQVLKPGIMGAMKLWGLSDELVTGKLRNEL